VPDEVDRGLVGVRRLAVDQLLDLAPVDRNRIERMLVFSYLGERHPEMLRAAVLDREQPRLLDGVVVEQHLNEGLVRRRGGWRRTPATRRGGPSGSGGGGSPLGIGAQPVEGLGSQVPPPVDLLRPEAHPRIGAGVRSLLEPLPHQRGEVVGPVQLEVGAEHEVVESSVGTVGLVGEGDESALGPLQRVVASAGFREDLGDLQEVVGVGEVAGHHRDTGVDVAGLDGKPLHHPLEVEPARCRVVARAGWPVRHLGPPFLGEVTHLGDAGLAQDVGVALDRVDEDVPLGVDVEREEATGECDRVGPDDHTCLVVEVLEIGDDEREVARGVVERAHLLVDSSEGIFGQVDDGLCLPGGKERPDAIDGCVHLAGPRARCARVAPAAAGGALGPQRVGERAAELGEIEGTARLGNLEEELVLQRRASLDLGHDELDESLGRLAGQVVAQLGGGLLRQLCHVASERCESFRARCE